MSFWTEARVGTLRHLWASGLSAEMIRREMQAPSRSSVIGKAHRLDLPPRITTQSANGKRKPDTWAKHKRPKVVRAVKIVPPKPVEMVLMPDRNTGDLVEAVLAMTDASCKFPMGSPGEDNFRFCGTQNHEGKQYCAWHYAVAYLPTTRKSSTVSTPLREVRYA